MQTSYTHLNLYTASKMYTCVDLYRRECSRMPKKVAEKKFILSLRSVIGASSRQVWFRHIFLRTKQNKIVNLLHRLKIQKSRWAMHCVSCQWKMIWRYTTMQRRTSFWISGKEHCSDYHYFALNECTNEKTDWNN